MANDYYTLEEVCDILSLSAADVKAMVADGRLHELRDAGRIFFRRPEVDKMAEKEGSSIVDMVATDDAAGPAAGQDADSFASALSSLADSSSSLGLGDASPGAGGPVDLSFADDSPSAAGSPGGSSMGISPIEMSPEDFPEQLPAAAPARPVRTPPPKASAPPPQPAELSSEIDLLPTGGSEENLMSDPMGGAAGEVPDLGLSGSSIINLEGPADEPAPARPAAKAPGKGGISVFDDDELEIASDPMGETRISAGVDELEAVGSGSGLLDLTQVSDDTSLGAELLDVISPSQEAADTETEEPVVEAAETVEDSGAITATADEEEPAFPTAAVGPAAAAAVAAPRMAAYSAMRGGATLNVCMILGVLALAALGLGTAGTLQGVWPDYLSLVARGVVYYSVFGGLALVAIVTGILSILADRK